jgi:hypothetical protein
MVVVEEEEEETVKTRKGKENERLNKEHKEIQK